MWGWCVCDEFGFAWSNVVETLEEAYKQLENLRKEEKENGWNWQWNFKIERRKMRD